MKKNFYLILISMLMAGCNNNFEEEIQTPVELHLDKEVAYIHACQSKDCEYEAINIAVIKIRDGVGDYWIESESEYLWYSSPMIEMYPSEYKVTDVLKLSIEGKEIKIEYLSRDIPVWNARFTIYDRDGNYAKFTVTDPQIVTWI